jgi:predicted GNAT family acetyltransferase
MIENMSGRANVTVEDNPDKHRYEAVSESGVVAGFVSYRRRDDNLVLIHTEVDQAFEGQGVGSALARGALDNAREAGRPVEVKCPFLSDYIERHPEYQDLVA